MLALTALSPQQADLARDAACDLVEHRAGDFFKAHLLLPAVVNDQYRRLVLAGVLELDGPRVTPTPAGRVLLERAR